MLDLLPLELQAAICEYLTLRQFGRLTIICHTYDVLWRALSVLEPEPSMAATATFVSVLRKISKYNSQVTQLALPGTTMFYAPQSPECEELFLRLFPGLHHLRLAIDKTQPSFPSAIFKLDTPRLESLTISEFALPSLAGKFVSQAPSIKRLRIWCQSDFNPTVFQYFPAFPHLEELSLKFSSIIEQSFSRLVDFIASNAKEGFRLKIDVESPNFSFTGLMRQLSGQSASDMADPTKWSSLARDFRGRLKLPISSFSFNGFSVFPRVLAASLAASDPTENVLTGISLFHDSNTGINAFHSMAEALRLIPRREHSELIAKLFWHQISSQPPLFELLTRGLPMLDYANSLKNSALSQLIFRIHESWTAKEPDQLLQLVKLHFECLSSEATVFCVENKLERSLQWAMAQPASWRHRYLRVNALTSYGSPTSCYLAQGSAKFDSILSDPALDVCIGGPDRCLAHHIATTSGFAPQIIAVLTHKSMRPGVLSTKCILERTVSNTEVSSLLRKLIQPLDTSVIFENSIQSMNIQAWWKFLESYAMENGISRQDLFLSFAHHLLGAALSGTMSTYSASTKMSSLLKIEPLLPSLIQAEIDSLEATKHPMVESPIETKRHHLSGLERYQQEISSKNRGR